MNAREILLATLDREPVDRLAVDLWCTPEVEAALREHTGTGTDTETWRALGLDKIVWVFPDYEADEDRTAWGAPLKRVRAGEGHYDEVAAAPLAGFDTPESLDDYPHWPDPARFEYDDAFARAAEARRDFAVIGPWVSHFEIYCQLRGLEQGLLDLLISPDLVDAVLDRVEAIQTAMMTRLLASGLFDLVFLSDDLGTQSGLLFSPETWRRHLEPRLRRWCSTAHDLGVRTFYHSDGAIGPLIGEILDCGVDVLNPIQHACPGMDPAGLKREYGGRVIFHGGVDNQRVLPFGTPEEVRKEVRMLSDTLGAGGEGFICGSCHNAQAGTPVENILAMIDEAGRCGV
jgi:uroporphyrinogen decarboxylase